ncbi:ABC transporter substrate-binding protein [Neorhizobium sp. NCHU2750]|uniref:ABC transporter substrate-binding protein n=1 Tax=Neorhizobium sp. NCHU2750 TaxID=1825976 RepID=UPI000EB6FC09|nr:iron ABC transporter substrate-binding protein [Neorhizobium sp. NCHU2750]
MRPHSDTRLTIISRRRMLAACAALAAGSWRTAHAATPISIATTDWAAAECLLALGAVPIAVPDTAVYRQWMETIPLPESVADLGSRAEPNLELLSALRPDRILISNWQTSLIGQFERIAPVQTVTIIDPPASPIANARKALVEIGRLLSAEEAASHWLAGFDRTQQAAAASLKMLNLRDVIIGVLHENGRQIYAYGPGSWVHEMIVLLGLNNALRAPTSRFGNALIDIAELTEMPQARLLYLDQGERTRRAEVALAGSTVWNGIPMVAAGRVRPIPVFYPLGGVPSVQRFIEILAQAALSTGEGR